MASAYWTGPRDHPRRYKVETTDGVARSEPGGGAEGLVYRAVLDDPEAPDHGAVVALKMLLTRDPVQLVELERRLGPLADVEDPRIMRVREVFVGTALTDDLEPSDEEFDVSYVVADWVEGLPLGEAAASSDATWALHTVASLGEAVAILHAVTSPEAPEGIVHRDIKTSNVRVDSTGVAVLVDYGLMRPHHSDASVVGTPGWLAPEVASGIPGAKAADAYGVGAIAHDLLVGSPPRRDGALAAVERFSLALSDHANAHSIARHLAQLLRTDPEDRPSDLRAWSQTLRTLTDTAPRPNRTRRRVSLAVACLMVLATIGAVMYASSRDQDVVASGAGADTSSPRALPVAEGNLEAPTTTRSRAERGCLENPPIPNTPVGTLVRSAYDELSEPCALNVDAFGTALVLRLLGEDDVAGDVIIASPDSPAVTLTAGNSVPMKR